MGCITMGAKSQTSEFREASLGNFLSKLKHIGMVSPHLSELLRVAIFKAFLITNAF